MGRHKGGGTVHFVTRNGKGRLVEIDQSEYYAAQADPDLVEMMPGHFIKKSTAEKYGLMPPEPELVFEPIGQMEILNRKAQQFDHAKSAVLRAYLDAQWEASKKAKSDGP